MKRVHREPLPSSGVQGLMARLRHILNLPQVQEINLSPTEGITVVREMPDAESPVVPPQSNDVDIEHLLDTVTLTPLPFVPDEHGMMALQRAVAHINTEGREAVAILIPSWRLLEAWLGVGLGPGSKPVRVFGVPVHLTDPRITNKRIVVCGGQLGSYLSEVDIAVSIDLGV